jgi:creatinine amidohydrolase/Fe(II)-dependent formamide hydrolase-like protein
MTDQQPFDATEPPAEPASDQPAAEEPAVDSAGSRAREWLSQLETMIQQVAREAAPVAREVGAKAAELAAVAAVKAGPVAQRAAAATTEYGQRFAEKAQSVAADWRQDVGASKAGDDGEVAASEEAPKELTEPPSEA